MIIHLTSRADSTTTFVNRVNRPSSPVNLAVIATAPSGFTTNIIPSQSSIYHYLRDRVDTLLVDRSLTGV
jgi:hypothetical protein